MKRRIVTVVLLVMGLTGAGAQAGPSSSWCWSSYNDLFQAFIEVFGSQFLNDTSGTVAFICPGFGFLGIGGGEATFDEWEQGGQWHQDTLGGQVWVGPDGKGYASPQHGWAKWQLTNAMMGAWDQNARAVVETADYTLVADTVYSRSRLRYAPPVTDDFPKGTAVQETVSLTVRDDDVGLTLALPVQRQEYDRDYDAMDFTSAGLQLTPFYRLLREDLHWINLVLAVNAGIVHQWFDDRGKLDGPIGEPWGLGSFHNPTYANLGGSVGVGKRILIGSLGAALSQERYWDLSRNSFYGDEEQIDVTRALLGWRAMPVKHIVTGVDTQFTYNNDVPSDADTSTMFTTVTVGYVEAEWAVTVSLGRDWNDQNVDRTSYGLRFVRNW